MNPKRIHPESGFAKRMAVRALRRYAKTLPESQDLLPPGHAEYKLLIQAMGGIGNTLMATPLIAATRRIYPNARIDFLTSPAAESLLQSNPHLSSIITDASDSSHKPAASLRLVRELRRTRYHAVLAVIPAHLARYAIPVLFARIPVRIIHEYPFRPHDDFSTAYSHVVPRRTDQHDVQSNLDLLAALAGVPQDPSPLEIHLSPENRRDAEAILAQNNLSSKNTIAICPGSARLGAYKRWPLSHAVGLAKRIDSHNKDLRVVVPLGPEEHEEAAEWTESLQATQVRILRDLPLATFAAILERMSAVVANDSLPMHICAALQTPVVALFGPTHETRTGPWRCPARILRAQVDYAPYYENPYPYDPSQFPDCMRLISVELVYDTLLKFLRESPRTAQPAHEAWQAP